jgi:trans-aconitate methyltransferase
MFAPWERILNHFRWMHKDRPRQDSSRIQFCLDVGCGDGTIDNLIMARRSDVKIEGIDPLVRPNA